MKKIFLFLLFLVIIVPLAWVLTFKYEGTAPDVTVDLPSMYLKKSYEMSFMAMDSGTGLRNVTLSIMQKGNEKTLLDRSYPASSILSLFSDNRVSQEEFTVPIEAEKYGMSDGEAVIRIRVSDYAWKSWNKGNVYYAEKKLIIDSTAPKVQILSHQHNITKGGSGIVIYRLFEADIQSGVKVDDNYFPGYAGLFEDDHIYAALFALDYTQGPGTKIRVTARDPAGNIAQKGFHHYIKDKKFKTDILNIPDQFLDTKMPDFSVEAASGGERPGDNPMLNKFLEVNRKLREANVKKILEIPANTVNEMLWEGRFTRLAGAANRAGFADQRIYKYKGREIDRAVHMGIDLASTAHAPVGAANNGRVIFSGDVGIFGNTVIIDHGFGLSSLYAHLSGVNVSVDDKVAKGDIIGQTGKTGLAGGDHLHFSIIVHNVFVTPVEWWDSSWIKNNITSKIKAAGPLKKTEGR